MVDRYSIDNEILISLVKQHPVLWDKSMEPYKNRQATQAAWKKITTALNPDFEKQEEKIRKACVKLVIQRWTHIRDNYNRSNKKRQEVEKSTSGAKTVKPYVYSRKLSFLQNPLHPRTSNVTDNNSTESDDLENSSDANEINHMPMATITPIVDTVPERAAHSDVDHLDAKMMNCMNSYSNNEPETMNRHLSFFHGILPSLEEFGEDEVLEFQMGVLQLVKNIRHGRQNRQSQQSMSFKVDYDSS